MGGVTKLLLGGAYAGLVSDDFLATLLLMFLMAFLNLGLMMLLSLYILDFFLK